MIISRILFLTMFISILVACKRTPADTSQQEERNALTTNDLQPNENAIKIACIGNSITEGSGLNDKANDSYPAQLQQSLGTDFHVKNFGVSSRTLLRKGDFPYWNEDKFQDAKDFQPDVVIILLGTNDSKPQNWVYKDDFVKDYQIFVDEFQALDSKPKIFICNPLPAFPHKGQIDGEVIMKEIIPKIEKIAISKELEILDLYEPFIDKNNLLPDAVHPNEEGAALLAKEVEKYILNWKNNK